MSKISATIVADSISPQGHRIVSLIGVIPRIVLAELNTHRMLSKNSASSRAIPIKRMLEIVQNDPFIPIAYQKEHTGMQGTEYYTDEEFIKYLNFIHLKGRNYALEIASMMGEKNKVTKQLANRYLEPFMWHTVLITATEYENFFELRCPQYMQRGKIFKSRKDSEKDFVTKYNGSRLGLPVTDLDWLAVNSGGAEIHISTFAECIWDAMNESTPKQLKPGEWHIPFEDKIEDMVGYAMDGSEASDEEFIENCVKVSTAMGARTSYTTVGDEKEVKYETLIGIHDKMAVAKPFHASPFEHPNRCMDEDEYFNHKKQYVYKGVATDKMLKEVEQGITQLIEFGNYWVVVEFGWCRNMRGFIQYRALLENK